MPGSLMAQNNRTILLGKVQDRPHHGLKLLVSGEDIVLPMTEACSAASWDITESALRALVKLTTAREQHACCLNAINLFMKLMTFQVTASESDHILEGPPLVVATKSERGSDDSA